MAVERERRCKVDWKFYNIYKIWRPIIVQSLILSSIKILLKIVNHDDDKKRYVTKMRVLFDSNNVWTTAVELFLEVLWNCILFWQVPMVFTFWNILKSDYPNESATWVSASFWTNGEVLKKWWVVDHSPWTYCLHKIVVLVTFLAFCNWNNLFAKCKERTISWRNGKKVVHTLGWVIFYFWFSVLRIVQRIKNKKNILLKLVFP